MSTAINIRLISTSTVRPPASSIDHCTELTHSRIELTPWDLKLLQLDYIQKGLLFYKPSADSDTDTVQNDNLVQHLKTTLSQALDILFPLSGRLAVTENDVVDDNGAASFFIDCNGAGALFVHAAADGVTVANILEPLIVPDQIVYSFFLMNGVLSYEAAASKLPLLALQMTELVDGVFIGCSMNHGVVDGTLFWNFFNLWSEISRVGRERVSQCSGDFVFGREYLDGVVNLPIRIPLLSAQKFTPPPLQQRVFRFTKEKIVKLKAKANAEKTSGENDVSSLQALLAHLWISITRNRRLKADDEVIYSVTVGLRNRIEPPLPEGYLGNAIGAALAKSTAGELVERGLGWAARLINRAIGSQTTIEVRKSTEDWVKNPKVAHMGNLPPNVLITGSSPRFNIYGNDFGWGRPIAVRSGPGNKIDGKLTPFPGTEEGSVDFEVCLRPETLQALACDEYFLGN